MHKITLMPQIHYELKDKSEKNKFKTKIKRQINYSIHKTFMFIYDKQILKQFIK